MKKIPLIGITLDYEQQPTYSKLPWYALRENYCAAISRQGALPLPLPHEVELAEHYLSLIDGLMITGGAFDVSPELYGDKTIHKTVTTKERRTKFEWAITQGCIKNKKPILGICGGEQLLNVILGGTLIQHIPETIPNALEHEQKNPRNEAGHEVIIVEGTLLHKIIFANHESRITNHVINVNSAHHQAVDKPALGVIVNARAPDGVIEGIELPDHPFCLGVQWHPEYHVDEADEKIFKAFVQASRQ